jgi:predicted transcriptional regulator of viral defense system
MGHDRPVGPFADAYGEPGSPGTLAAAGAPSPDERVSLLASRQHGVISTIQLRECGLTDQAIHRRVAKRRRIRLHLGVYAVGQLALHPRWRDHAAVLAYGAEALLSHRSAADLWGMRRTSSPRIEVTAPRGRRGRAGITLHRSRLIHAEDGAAVDAIPVTSVARTLIDLADVLSLSALQRAINEAELLGLLELTAVARTLERLPNRRGRGRLHRALDLYRPASTLRAAAVSETSSGSAWTMASPSPRPT